MTNEEAQERASTGMVVAKLQQPACRAHFDHTMEHLGSLLPQLLKIDRHALYALYCAGRSDYSNEMLRTHDVQTDAADATAAMALAEHTKALGISADDLKSAMEIVTQSMQQEAANERTRPN
jgi:hypothetical protein